jgi:hypothetical protein
MSENPEVQDEFANLSLLLLSWILECQDAPAPGESKPEVVSEEVFAAARIVSGHLLKQAERRAAQRPTALSVQEKFGSLVSSGCRTVEGGGYRLESDDDKKCITGVLNKTRLGRCLIPGKAPTVSGRLP